jgi:GTP-binding protein YchF
VSRRIDKANKLAKGDKKYLAEADLFTRLQAHMDDGLPARTFPCGQEERALIGTAPLLSGKPVIYCANMDESGFVNQADNQYLQKVKEIAVSEGAEALAICAKWEEDIAALPEEERPMFLSELGLEEAGLDRLVRASYSLLGLVSYLTAGQPEVRAWTIRKGTKAPQAAGVIHTDFERGFIRAEVIAFDDLMAVGTMAAARDKGLIRSEGKDYVMRDGDIVLFRFNV